MLIIILIIFIILVGNVLHLINGDESINYINKQANITSQFEKLPDFNFAVAGDWGNGANAQRRIDNIKLSNPELVLGLGDYAYETRLDGIDSWWNRFILAGLGDKWVRRPRKS